MCTSDHWFQTPTFPNLCAGLPTPPHFDFCNEIGIVPKVGKVGIIAHFALLQLEKLKPLRFLLFPQTFIYPTAHTCTTTTYT